MAKKWHWISCVAVVLGIHTISAPACDRSNDIAAIKSQVVQSIKMQ